jgi:hypothetical protein
MFAFIVREFCNLFCVVTHYSAVQVLAADQISIIVNFLFMPWLADVLDFPRSLRQWIASYEIYENG